MTSLSFWNCFRPDNISGKEKGKGRVYKRPLRRTKADCWKKKVAGGKKKKSTPVHLNILLVKSLEIFSLRGIKPLKQMGENKS